MTAEALLEQVVHEFHLKNEALENVWRLSESAWFFDQDQGTITFSHADGTRASAPMQIVGSLNTEKGSWLWATAHDSVNADLAKHAALAQAELRRLGAPELAEDYQQANEERAWEYTALAAKLGGTQGVYRAPIGSSLLGFMTFGELTPSLSQA